MSTTTSHDRKLAEGVSDLGARISAASLRIGLGVLWLANVRWKFPPDFGEAHGNGVYRWTKFAVTREVWHPYALLVDNVILKHFTIFGWTVFIAEASLAAFLIVGLATRFWALIGVAQSAAIALSVLNAPNEWPWAYYLMILGHLGVFALAAGRVGGLDGVLRPLWSASDSRIARALVRAS